MIERIQSVVGADAVSIAPAAVGDSVRHDSPATHELPAVPTIAPGSAEEAATVLRLATEEGWKVRIAGGRASASAVPPDLILTTARLAGITEYEPADLVATAGAGTTLGALQSHLAGQRQLLPLDPPAGDFTTLGAIVSSARSGPLREGYGTPRDQVLGLRLVTGDGRVVECGGRVMKNVAGYDLVRLIVGSSGTLGLVTGVDLRLRALPERDQTIVLAARSAAPLVELVASLRETRVEAVALELLSPAANPTRGRDWLLLVRLHGNDAAVAAAAERIRSLASRGRGIDVVPGEEMPTIAESFADSAGPSAPTGYETGYEPDLAAPAGIWKALDQLEARAVLRARLADRPSELAATLETAMKLPGVAAGEVPVIAHAGAGIVRVLPGSRAQMDGWDAALPVVRAALSARRGTLRFEGALAGALQDGSLARGISGGHDTVNSVSATVDRLQREIRRRFDPAGTLAPQWGR